MKEPFEQGQLQTDGHTRKVAQKVERREYTSRELDVDTAFQGMTVDSFCKLYLSIPRLQGQIVAEGKNIKLL